jgi:hypothetical protein
LAGDTDDLYLEIYALEETALSRNEMTSGEGMRDRYSSGKSSGILREKRAIRPNEGLTIIPRRGMLRVFPRQIRAWIPHGLIKAWADISYGAARCDRSPGSSLLYMHRQAAYA